MTRESLEVRLARIEEGQKGIREDIAFYHREIVKPLTEDVANLKTDVTVTKRDRVWVSALVGGFAAWIGDKLWRG